MADRIKMNGVEIFQPDKGSLDWNFETTYSSDSARVQTGKGRFTPLFTVEQLGYSATNIPVQKATQILQVISTGRPFTLHYFSLYYGAWRDGVFRVGKGQCKIGSLSPDNKFVKSLSFNMTGDNPI